ncbi:NUDIX domain-containing protein [Candidatus Pacearchaeota archaeon]|nr:NUDIX domain-containing protein [Candidatus Pacearchaeota archaeon]
MPQEFTIGIIIYQGKDFLLLRHIPGHWGFLKDTSTPIETKDDTARRIVIENLSLKGLFIVKDFSAKESYFYMKDGKIIHKEVDYLLAESGDRNILLSAKFTDAKWLPYEQALQLATFKETKTILREANDFLRFH